MSFCSERLYNGYLRRSMPAIVSKVKVREIMIHLPCLTAHDRETIEAKRETCGNYDSMVLLLDCLKRRDNWPEQFITALEACEHLTLASDIRAEYDALRGGDNDSDASSPPTTVVRAHVHPAPPSVPLPVPETLVEAQSPEVSVQSPGVSVQSPGVSVQSPGVSVPSPGVSVPSPGVSVPSPEVSVQSPEVSVQSPEVVVQSPETPQSPGVSVQSPEVVVQSPETPQSPGVSVQSPEVSVQSPGVSVQTPEVSVQRTEPTNELYVRQEPEENSELDVLEVSGDQVDAPDGDPVRTESPTETPVDSVVSDESSFLTLTPQKTPVQDSAPPGDPGTEDVLKPERTNDGPATQVVETLEKPPVQDSAPQGDPETIDVLKPERMNDGPATQQVVETPVDSVVSDESTVVMETLEKPPVQDSAPQGDPGTEDVLKPERTTDGPATQVVEPLALGSAPLSPDVSLCFSKPGELLSTVPEPPRSPTVTPPTSPYSGDSARLEISVAQIPVNPASAPVRQENGVALRHDESVVPSFEASDVMTNVVHVSEEPSVLDLAGRSLASGANRDSGEKWRPSDPPVPESGPSAEARAPSFNARYVLTAAGVGVCALLMAWRLKN